MNGRLTVILLGAVLAGALGGLFIVDFGASEPEPVAFDETVTVGLSLEHERWMEAERPAVDLPRVQAFYSEYQYVVGYYGVEQFVTTQEVDRYERLLGYPLGVYVTAFEEGAVTLSPERFPAANGSYEWTAADEAAYVVGSDARTPAGSTVVPFITRSGAEQFSAEYGGTVLTWPEVLEESFDVDDAETVREGVTAQNNHADERVAATRALQARPTGAVVATDGEMGDGETIQDAVDSAPPNSTVVVPPGTYEEHVEIDRPITLAGEGDAEIAGHGNGTVVSVSANRTAITGLTITGVGGETPGAGPTEGHDHGTHDHGDGDDDAAWDETIEDSYARGDAGIAVDNSSGLLVENVTIDTNASGVMLRDSPDAVVRGVCVDGHPDIFEAHMGVVLMRSPAVVEHSTFHAGLDGVYTHRADGSVVRDNEMVDNRMGVHLMHTSDALLSNNTISSQSSAGIYVMTGPERNALVGNEIRTSLTGIDIGGTDSYVAENVLVDNDVGLKTDAAATLVERNVVVGNGIGVETWAILPTNRVVANDFVDNDRHVRSIGPLRIWTHDGAGNYWEGAVGTPENGVLDRPYTATDPIDSVLHQVDGAPTVAQAPVQDLLGRFQQAVSGLREGEVVDEAPRCEPTHGAWVVEHDYTPDPPCGVETAETASTGGG